MAQDRRRDAVVLEMTRFGSLLRSARLARDLSQNTLATLIAVDPAWVNRMERHGRVPSRIVVLALADALEMAPDDRDRFLFAAGHAPVRDFQSILGAVLLRLSAMRADYPGEVAS